MGGQNILKVDTPAHRGSPEIFEELTFLLNVNSGEWTIQAFGIRDDYLH